MNDDKAIEEMAENPKSALFKLAIPTFVSMGSIFLVTFFDSIWISGLGNVAVSAIGITGPVFWLLTLIGIGMGTSVNVSMSKSMAEKNILESNSIVKNTALMIIIFSILLPLIVLPFLKDIIIFIGGGEFINASYDYLSILIFFIGIFYVAEVIPFLLRLQGYIKAPVYINVLTCALNIVLDPLFIYYFGLGLKGAAIATVISVLVSCSLLIIMLFRTKGKYVSIGEYTYDKERDFEVLKKNLKIGAPIIFQSIASLIFGIILNRFFIYEGLVYITSYSFSTKIFGLIGLPLSAFSTSMLSVMGFLIGSGRYDDIKPTLKYVFYIVEITAIIPCIILFLGSDFLAAILYQTKDMIVINQISISIKLLAILNIFGVGASLIDCMFLSIEKPMKTFYVAFAAAMLDIILIYIMEYQFHIINSVYYVLIIASILEIIIYSYIFRKDLNEFLDRKMSDFNQDLDNKVIS